ncbi:hypothetical protein QJQ45_021482 [Haematococcus lacustris]|nr:hypothetical protein QJQ45_021482 [Haematococcus lacustris]
MMVPSGIVICSAFAVGIGVGSGCCYLYMSAQASKAVHHGDVGVGVGHAPSAGPSHSSSRTQQPTLCSAASWRTSGALAVTAATWDLVTRLLGKGRGQLTWAGMRFQYGLGHQYLDIIHITSLLCISTMPLVEPLLPPLLQAPAADHRNSQEAMDQTFSPLNISPQVGEGFNRDYWCRLERHLRSLTSLCADVFLVTGPLFMPTLKRHWPVGHEAPLDWSVEAVRCMGCAGAPPSLVATGAPASSPLKSDAASGGSGSSSSSSAVSSPLRSEKDMAVAAFVLPNAPIDPHTPLSAFVCPWSRWRLWQRRIAHHPASGRCVLLGLTPTRLRAGAVVQSSKKQGTNTDLSLPRTRSAAHALHLCEVTISVSTPLEYGRLLQLPTQAKDETRVAT